MASEGSARVHARGKFLFEGEEKRYLRGITYGTFRPTLDGDYGAPDAVERDFAQMAACGINTVRTYSAPPRWLLDAASRHGLRVLVGLAWEQHIAFLEERERPRAIVARVREDVRACAGHPAVFGYAIGNEIPAAIVRWHGRHRIERFIERLYLAVKMEDPTALVTYVNYPSTEYLQLPFLDFVAFNVYLETEEKLAAYIARLQNIAGDRPLVIAELGLDSLRNGTEMQATTIGWQLRATFAGGCAGAFVFKWTDEWYRGGNAVTDWDFGVTDRWRQPKPALQAVALAFADLPFPADTEYPRFSVIVCSRNGARTLRDCCAGLRKLTYPNYEVIVVDDGSADATATIATEYGFRVISIPNGGLSNARNVGLRAASGTYVAYLDDDAWPDPDWLTYLSALFRQTGHVGIGGPNIPPPDDSLIARCVGYAPGGPMHVLLSDHEAEHIPGCNMVFRRDALEAIGGFDAQFRIAGDDVDVCWKLQQRGWTLGFSPSAVVWHHRRDSIRRYWRQQVSYGKAEALLERKWPEKYNFAGHLTWTGRIYGTKLTYLLRRIGRIYQGTWGSALFQSLDQPAPGLFASFPQVPEWYGVVALLALLSALGFRWPLLGAVAAPLLVLALAVTFANAAAGAVHGVRSEKAADPSAKWRLWGIITLLYLLQPLARLIGRVRSGLTPWRSRTRARSELRMWRTYVVWREHWCAAERWLELVEAHLKSIGGRTYRGGSYDRWDLKVSAGLFGAAFTQMVVEEHADGKQLVRFRIWPRCSAIGGGLMTGALLASILAIVTQGWRAGALVAILPPALVLRTLWECALATGTILQALRSVAATLAADDVGRPVAGRATSVRAMARAASAMAARAEAHLHTGAVEGD